MVTSGHRPKKGMQRRAPGRVDWTSTVVLSVQSPLPSLARHVGTSMFVAGPGNVWKTVETVVMTFVDVIVAYSVSVGVGVQDIAQCEKGKERTGRCL